MFNPISRFELHVACQLVNIFHPACSRLFLALPYIFREDNSLFNKILIVCAFYSTRDIGLVRIIPKMDPLAMIYVAQMFQTSDRVIVMKHT